MNMAIDRDRMIPVIAESGGIYLTNRTYGGRIGPPRISGRMSHYIQIEGPPTKEKAFQSQWQNLKVGLKSEACEPVGCSRPQNQGVWTVCGVLRAHKKIPEKTIDLFFAAKKAMIFFVRLAV